jgi:hypothetical protein
MLLRTPSSLHSKDQPIGMAGNGVRVASPANDNDVLGLPDPLVRAALRHFASQGLEASRDARRWAQAALMIGEDNDACQWLQVCALLGGQSGVQPSTIKTIPAISRPATAAT